MMKTLVLAASAAAVAVAGTTHLGGRYGAVRDRDQAARVARREFNRRGDRVEGPLKVTHTNGVWRVVGRYPAGRTSEVYIRDDGRVPSINPGKLKLVPVVANRPDPDPAALTQATY